MTTPQTDPGIGSPDIVALPPEEVPVPDGNSDAFPGEETSPEAPETGRAPAPIAAEEK